MPQPGTALSMQQGVVAGLDECAVSLQQLSDGDDFTRKVSSLRAVADASFRYLRLHGYRFERMQDTLQFLPIPHVDAESVRQWFGAVKDFPDIELLVQIISRGAPVPVSGQGDLSAALAYGNHSASDSFHPQISEKIVEDVMNGRAFVFPRTGAYHIPGIRIFRVFVYPH